VKRLQTSVRPTLQYAMLISVYSAICSKANDISQFAPPMIPKGNSKKHKA